MSHPKDAPPWLVFSWLISLLLVILAIIFLFHSGWIEIKR
jgi:hypothetical protein